MHAEVEKVPYNKLLQTFASSLTLSYSLKEVAVIQWVISGTHAFMQE